MPTLTKKTRSKMRRKTVTKTIKCATAAALVMINVLGNERLDAFSKSV